MPMTRTPAGIVYCLTSVVIAFTALAMMMQSVNGAPVSWLGPVVLGLAILLMTAGIRAFVPRIPVVALSLIAGLVPILICSLCGEWPLRCWLFGAVLAISAWAVFTVDKWVGRGDTASTLISSLLAASWVGVTIDTIKHAVSNAASSNGPLLAVLMIYWALILLVLVNASRTFRIRAQH